jgi:hypothetical protein
MARGLKQQQQQQQGWKEETSINTYICTCTHALSLNLSPSPTPPKTPSNEHVHLPKGNAIRSWKQVWLRVMNESKKINWKQKKRKHDPWEEKNFFYIHKEKRKESVMLIIALHSY